MLKGKLCLGYCPQGTGTDYPFNEIFPVSRNLQTGFEGVDAVVLWGGEDIHPSYYNEEPHPLNQARNNLVPSRRDVFEWKVMLHCYTEGIPIIGVCRGAQFLCAFAGGSLVQHVNNHTNGNHLVTTSHGEILPVTSCHHQMMYPYDVEHELLAWSKEKRSTFYEGPKQAPIASMDTRPEPEVVYFPKVRGLAIQGHPEWAQPNSRFVSYVNELVKTRLLNQAVVAA